MFDISVASLDDGDNENVETTTVDAIHSSCLLHTFRGVDQSGRNRKFNLMG